MTLLDFILKLRDRLQDRRTVDGHIISNIESSGTRWSATQMLDLANNSFSETSRLIAMYSQSKIMQQLAGDALVGMALNASYTAGGLTISSEKLGIISVVNTTGNDGGHGYITPRDYLQYKADSKQPRNGENFYTVIYDPATTTKKLLLLPDTNRAVSYTYIYAKTDYAVGDTGATLPFAGIIDLVLDVAERAARDIEHNWDRSANLDKRIAVKLGINIS